MIKRAVCMQGYFKGARLRESLKVLNFIVKSYENINNGDAYLKQAIRVCRHLINRGIKSDTLLAASLLYKVSENTGMPDKELKSLFKGKVFSRMCLLFRDAEFKMDKIVDDDYPEDYISKEAAYIKGFATGAGCVLTLKALYYIIEKFKGRKREDGSDGVSHSIDVCRYLLNHGERDDVILAAALLHDVREDTGAAHEDLIEIFGREAADLVDLLSKKRGMSPEEYHKGIQSDIRAIKIKAADRTCNVDTMIGVYNEFRLEKYDKESTEYILPGMKRARRIYLDDSDLLVALRDHIKGVMRAAREVIRLTRIIARLKIVIKKLARKNLELKRENKKLKNKIKTFSK